MSSGLKRLNDSGSSVTNGANFTGQVTLQFGAALSPSAGVLTLGSDGNSFHIGGTVQNITSITNITGSGPFFCIMDSTHTLVHATGTLETNTGANIVCAIGDRFRFDQDSDGTTWLVTQEGKGVASSGNGSTTSLLIYQATGNGTKTVFSNLDFAPTNFSYNTGANALFIFIDGVYQQKLAYTETNGTTITFNAPIPAGSIIEVRVSSVSATTSTSFLSGSRGVFGGGITTVAVNTIDYITIGTVGNATNFGTLTAARRYLAATSDGSRGVFGGGYTTTNTNTIDYITIGTLGNATNFGTLTTARSGLAATSDGSRGVFGGGITTTVAINTIDYITIGTVGNAINFGTLTVARYELAATSDGSRGVFGGGFTTINVNTIDYISIGTLGNATNFGTLTVARVYSAATSDGSRGVFGGGYTTTYVNTIDYIAIGTLGNATNFGTLTAARSSLAATSDGSRGVFGGGYTTITANTIDYITIGTLGNATNFGTLTAARGYLAATSGT